MERELFARQSEAEQRELGATTLERTGCWNQLESVAVEFEEWSKSIRETALLQRGSVRRWAEHKFVVQVSNVSKSSKENPDSLLDGNGMRADVLFDLEKSTLRAYILDGKIRFWQILNRSQIIVQSLCKRKIH